MATGVASQVILHPTASQTIQLLGTTAGRDKVNCHPTLTAFRPELMALDYTVDIPNYPILLSISGLVSDFTRAQGECSEMERIEVHPRHGQEKYAFVDFPTVITHRRTAALTSDTTRKAPGIFTSCPPGSPEHRPFRRANYYHWQAACVCCLSNI